MPWISRIPSSENCTRSEREQSKTSSEGVLFTVMKVPEPTILPESTPPPTSVQGCSPWLSWVWQRMANIPGNRCNRQRKDSKTGGQALVWTYNWQSSPPHNNIFILFSSCLLKLKLLCYLWRKKENPRFYSKRNYINTCLFFYIFFLFSVPRANRV